MGLGQAGKVRIRMAGRGLAGAAGLGEARLGGAGGRLGAAGMAGQLRARRGADWHGEYRQAWRGKA